MPATWKETAELQLDELTPFPGNARRGDPNVIARSIVRNGQYRAIVARIIGARTILAGNHTHAAMLKLAAKPLVTDSSPRSR